MKRIALFGAGAEADLGFSTGADFTRDTFYRNKTMLYESLREFYKERLRSDAGVMKPDRYIAAFLLQPIGSAFKALVSNIVKEQPEFIDQILGGNFDRSTESLKQSELRKLYERLIVENDSSDELWRQNGLFKCLPADMHFGILEPYFSELIKPGEHPVRFWKLINYYWSAFFSIALPICDTLYSAKGEYCENRYKYVLDELNVVVKDIYSNDNVSAKCKENCYYNYLRGLFDGVITTNYTPYSSFVVDFDEARLARLSGSLSSFEALETLSVFDARQAPIGNSEFVFPYMMCQSPVKPIIDSSQLKEFSKAINMLKDADELVVLGYSFCREDTHIANLVSSAARTNQNLMITFLSYDKDADPYSDFKRQEKAHAIKYRVLHDMRLTEADRLFVKLVSKCDSQAIKELQM